MTKIPAETARTTSVKNKYWLVIPAAGIGKRMGAKLPKQYLTIAGRSILNLTLDRLGQLENVEKIVLVLHPEDCYWQPDDCTNDKVMTVCGGDERFDSVVNGLNAIGTMAHEQDWVLVHDAVRPCVALTDIEQLMLALQGDPVGGILASPVRETLKKTFADNSNEHIIESTPVREQHWLAATPQMFRYGLLLKAMKAVSSPDTAGEQSNKDLMTDEAAVMAASGHQVKIIAGRSDNIKVTHPEDLKLVDFILNHSAS